MDDLFLFFCMSLMVGIPLIILIRCIAIIKSKRPQTTSEEIMMLVIYLGVLVVSGIGFCFHFMEYNVAIVPDDDCYTPFEGKHSISLFVYLVYFNISLFSLWFWKNKISPLLHVFFLIGLCLGLLINFVVLIQLSNHNTQSIRNYVFLSRYTICIYPLLTFILGICQLLKILRNEMDTSITRHFKNPFLERCNQFLSQRYSVTIWALIFMLPVFIIITLILILFGQDANSLVKVFTDTTTWTFSQKMHPPILDHQGHYLCTVAAKGDPTIVKPIRLGKRHGRTIIVNRQLQIANAFEELISDYTPLLHRFIRKNYDKYGYNLSLKINSKMGSNITYVLMKPLEWFFLITLYLFCNKPEIKIKKQYA